MSTTTASPPASAAKTSGDGAFTHRQILTILSGLMLGMFLAALDQNIVSTSIRTIADDLNGLNLQAWATTAYLITATISTPLYGKLSDLYGRKPFFLFAIGVFVIGSVLCTISTSMYELAIFRAIQGAGAGGLMSLALTIIGDIVPPRERARYQGYFLAVFGTSSVIGPVVGGFFAGTDSIIGVTGWRWVFLVNVPIGIIAFTVVWRVLNLPHTRREHRIDWPGAASLAVALVPLLIVAEQGQTWGWDSTWAIVCYVVGVVGIIAFVLSERAYGDDALLPLRLFRNGVFSLTTVIAVITGIGMFGGIAIVPQYLQIVGGSSPTQAGLEMIPLVGGIMVASIISGQLTSRTGRYKVFPVIGLGLMTLGMFLFHFLLHADTPYWQVAVLMVVFGLGLGNCMQTLVLAVQNAVPASDMGVATASATFFRQMGGTLGVSVFLSILFSTLGGNITSAFRGAASSPDYRAALADPAVTANPVNAAGLDPASGAAQVTQDSSILQQMDPRLARPFFEGFAASMDLVFLVAACVIAVGFVLIWFLKEVPLRTTSGIQARQAEQAGQGAGPGSVDSAAEVDGPARGALDVPASAPAVGAAGAAGGERVLRPSPVPRPHGRHEAPTRGGDSVVLGRLSDGVLPDEESVRFADDVAGVPMALHALDGTVVDRTFSAADGSYRLHAPLPGNYVVVANPSTFKPHAELVSLDGVPVHRPLALRRATPVGGSVRDTADTPVVGATVTVTDASGGVRAVRRTGADGSWECPELEPGSYTVAVLAPGREPVAERLDVAEATPAGRRSTRHDVRVPVARHAVRGQVRSTSGAVVPESLVVLMGADGRVVASTVTDTAGRFAVEDLAEGRYLLTASGFAPVSEQVTVGSGAHAPAVELTVDPPQPVRTPSPVDAETTPLPVTR
ncbi:DHA2 family efflux MFS transporter permease subunit [Actinomycetospora soli]|uniref:DHA2 family efflux MFS transporter permease subunit n=1 Tax=Actinomycetospora soli TaxID=2893887 RepID=UPI001E47D2FD|nr:DHA2 family efflux MFS transporter permease subunit [Actinomycetospora soli]MCD2190810.1 DHA2 family efflux MFS transporter permease subunit [Actinomycetospora soli]